MKLASLIIKVKMETKMDADASTFPWQINRNFILANCHKCYDFHTRKNYLDNRSDLQKRISIRLGCVKFVLNGSLVVQCYTSVFTCLSK